jgi:polyhydroxybutyrate depolymerase
LLAALALAPTGCHRRVDANLKTVTIDHGGLLREVHVHLPPGHEAGAPLVIALHGGGGRGALMDRFTGGGLSREADRRGWVLALPEGVDNGWNDGRPAVSARDRARADVDDVGFVGAVIDRMKADHGIDDKRVYVTGMSNGGFMALSLALALGDRIAAAATVTASLPKVHEGATPKRRVPLLVMNGTEDPLVPYNGGQVRVLGQVRGEILSTADTMRWFAKANGCIGAAVRNQRPDISADDTRVVVDSYDSCKDDGEVVLFRIDGGGHTWPSGSQYLPEGMVGRVSYDIDASDEIFSFFAPHKLP